MKSSSSEAGYWCSCDDVRYTYQVP